MDLHPLIESLEVGVSPLHECALPVLVKRGIHFRLKRDDSLGGNVQGNKWRKLKYTLSALLQAGEGHVASFGGPYSNHLYAMASACARLNILCTLFVRGYPGKQLTGTLQYCSSLGARVIFLSLSDYSRKENVVFLTELSEKYGHMAFIPEGGSQTLAYRGVAELIHELPADYTHLCVPVGTGGTLIGLAMAVPKHVGLLGFSTLKGIESDEHRIRKLSGNPNVRLVEVTGGKGYGRLTDEQAEYALQFWQEHKILLDPVYTAPMLLEFERLVVNGEFSQGSRIVAIHTGGIQGWCGYSDRDPRNIIP